LPAGYGLCGANVRVTRRNVASHVLHAAALDWVSTAKAVSRSSITYVSILWLRTPPLVSSNSHRIAGWPASSTCY